MCGFPAKLYTIAKDFAVPITALVWGITTWVRDNRRILSIQQIGSSVTSRIAVLEGMFTTVFVVDEVLITNDSPKATITIASYSVDPPWADLEIEALADPKELVPQSDQYSVFGYHVKYPRKGVINHLRFQDARLQPGDTIRGTFLAKGKNEIPMDLGDGRGIAIEFIVKDTKGKAYKQNVRVFPERVPNNR